MARIRVLEIAEAAGGGVLRHLFQIAEGLDRAEFDLTLALSPERMPHPERVCSRFERLGARVVQIPMVRRPAPMADLRALGELKRLMRSERFDVVHAHSSKAGFLGRLAARQTGLTRVFYTPHAFAFQRGGPVGWLYREFERLGARFGGRLVAVSAGERRLAVDAGLNRAARGAVIPNAIEPPERPTPEQRAAARRTLGIAGDGPVVGTVGRLEPQKACDDLLLAMPDVLARYPVAQVVLIGSGSLESDLRSLAEQLGIADRVTLAGHRDDADSLYAAMDLYVQPSLWEGLPYALLEAMGRALPVVATDVPGNRDLVGHDRTGLLVRPDAPPALAGAILALLDRPESARTLGEAGRDKVLREHRREDFIRAISSLYRGE